MRMRRGRFDDHVRRPDERLDAMIAKHSFLREAMRKMCGRYDCVLLGPDGEVKWEDHIDNIVVNEGLSYLLDVGLSNGTQIDPWYCGLLAASPTPLATWTATEIASNDFVDYDESVLQEWAETGESSQSITAPAMSFAINSDSSSIGGAFLISTSTKGTPAGTLYSAGAFAGGNKAADDGDTLQVTATFTAADDA